MKRPTGSSSLPEAAVEENSADFVARVQKKMQRPKQQAKTHALLQSEHD